MKLLVLLFVLAVLILIGYGVALLVTRTSRSHKQKKDAKLPWIAYQYPENGRWWIIAQRGEDVVQLAAPFVITEGDFTLNMEIALAEARENFMGLRPRGKWTLEDAK